MFSSAHICSSHRILLCWAISFVFSILASPTPSNVVNEEETKLLHSEIWTTLFRGGYMTGKLQRSLSGHHVSIISYSHFDRFISNTELCRNSTDIERYSEVEEMIFGDQ